MGGKNSPPALRQASYPQTVTHHLHISGDSIQSNHHMKHTGKSPGTNRSETGANPNQTGANRSKPKRNRSKPKRNQSKPKQTGTPPRKPERARANQSKSEQTKANPADHRSTISSDRRLPSEITIWRKDWRAGPS